MKLLCLVPTLYNPIVLFAVTTFWVVVVLSSQDTLAFRYDSYHIPLNHGDIVLRTLQFRGGSRNDIIKPIDNDNDEIDDHTYTNIAGIQIDDSFRGGGQYQRQHYSTATTPRAGGFIQRQNNFVGRLPRRFRDMRCNANKAWSQVTKGCSLRVSRSNQNSRNTDALLAVQVRGGADNHKKNHNQNQNVVNNFTKKGTTKSATDVVQTDHWKYSLLAVAFASLCIGLSPFEKGEGWYSLLAVALGFCLACSPFGNSRLADVLAAAATGV